MKKLTGVLWACLLAVVANAQVYVSVGGAGAKDGSNWANAMDNVAGALVIARTAMVKEVWVATGTYPATDAWGTSLGPNMAGITMYGGFEGNESAPAERKKKIGGRAYEFIHPTIIKSDVQFSGSVGKANPCIFDGFTWTEQTKPLAFRNNVFIRNCTWVNNEHTAHIVNAYLTDGAATDTKSGAVEGCLFLNNNGTSGSNVLQIAVTAKLPFVVKDCDFVGNTVTHRVIAGGDNTLISNCRFINNSAGASAGYVVNSGVGSQMVNCLISNNVAPHAVLNGPIVVVNTTIANNVTPSVYTWVDGAKVYNSILLGNVDAAGLPVGISGAIAGEVKNSAYSVALPVEAVVANNLKFAPSFLPFVAPSSFVGVSTTKQSELLQADWSLANKAHGLLNSGDNGFFANSIVGGIDRDLLGNTRIQNTTIDLGAFETPYIAPQQPTLTTVAGEGGTIDPLLTNSPRRVGEAIVLTASQNDGKEFLNWTNQSGTVLSEKSTFIFEMPETSATVIGNFQTATLPFQLSVLAGANGSVSTSGGAYYSGQKVRLEAIPNADYRFAAWVNKNGKIVSTNNPYELTMEKQDTLVKAIFKNQLLTRYLVSPNTVDARDPAPTWQRAAGAGEMIINLDEVMVDGQVKSLSLDEYFAKNYWPLPLSAGDEIWLLGGAYATFNTIEVTVPGIKIFGGFEGTETALNQRRREDQDGNGLNDPWEFISPSVLSGQMQVLEFSSSVLLLHADDLLVDGLVVEGGRQGAVDYGVGVNLGIRRTTGSGAIMRNSIIRRNLVTGSGSATAYVCGIFVWEKSLLESSLIENNLIDASNTGAAYGAGGCLGGGTLRNCVVRNNRNLAFGTKNGDVHGGGIRLGSGLMENCLVSNNFSQRGGGIYVGASDAAIVRYCTIVNNECGAHGGGVYFRGYLNSIGGGLMQNSIVWNNRSNDPVGSETFSNLFIEGDSRLGKYVKLGAIAYNGKSAIKDASGTFYTALNGNANSLEELPLDGVFNNPLETIGFNGSDFWESDWSPKLTGLGIAVPLAENESDILGRVRTLGNGAIGAYEFGSPLSIRKGKVELDPFVYNSQGALRVSFYQPVSVEIFDTAGTLLQSATAKNDHVFNLPKGAVYLVVVKSNDLSCSRKIAVQ